MSAPTILTALTAAEVRKDCALLFLSSLESDGTSKSKVLGARCTISTEFKQQCKEFVLELATHLLGLGSGGTGHWPGSR